MTTGGAIEIGALLDGAPCGFVAFGDDGTIRAINRTLLTRLGYTRDEVAGQHVEALLTVGARIFYQTHLFPLLRLHGHAEEIFLLLRARDGSDVGALANAVRHERDGEGIVECVVLEVRERRKFEDALLRAKQEAEEARAAAEAANELLAQQAVELELSQEQLQEQAAELERQREIAEEANRAKSQFLAVMSHELRTPLNAIAGYAQILQMGVHGPITDAQRDALVRISHSQRHLLRLVNDVLNLARIEAGRVDYRLEPVVLRQVVDSVLPLVEPQLAARDLHCEVEVPIRLSVVADREKVEQILLNLLSNAAKFTPPHGSVSVDAFPSLNASGGEKFVALRVRDTGIGIPADRLAAVFEPFVQVDVGHTRATDGTGLGLTISRDLARGMSGDLRARSVEGQGSAFTLVLPAAPQARSSAVGSQLSAEAQ